MLLAITRGPSGTLGDAAEILQSLLMAFSLLSSISAKKYQYTLHFEHCLTYLIFMINYTSRLLICQTKYIFFSKCSLQFELFETISFKKMRYNFKRWWQKIRTGSAARAKRGMSSEDRGPRTPSRTWARQVFVRCSEWAASAALIRLEAKQKWKKKSSRNKNALKKKWPMDDMDMCGVRNVVITGAIAKQRLLAKSLTQASPSPRPEMAKGGGSWRRL